jgi:hypothetical protein
MSEVFRPEDAYTKDEYPCVVARKKCGCYAAALVITDPNKPGALADFRAEATEYGATLEFRPVRFVRKGGLNFECTHNGTA